MEGRKEGRREGRKGKEEGEEEGKGKKDIEQRKRRGKGYKRKIKEKTEWGMRAREKRRKRGGRAELKGRNGKYRERERR